MDEMNNDQMAPEETTSDMPMEGEGTDAEVETSEEMPAEETGEEAA